MSSIHCPMIHGGLNINLKAHNGTLAYNQCCLSTVNLEIPNDVSSIWNSQPLESIRQQNNDGIWHSGCWECQRLESAGATSFRQSMINTFGVKTNLSGPQRIDLLFDRSCNIACVNCGPGSSTYWQKHLKENNLLTPQYSTEPNLEKIISTLSTLDLSNLEMVQFCGGETLMGNMYWKAAEVIADLVPHAKDRVTLGFQTNGTQPIHEKHYNTIEKFHLVKFLVSIDGTHNRFEYLRWPAQWDQVVENIMNMRESLPVNVMFLIQETINCLNLFYHNDVPDWVSSNFSNNRLGDPTDYSAQLVMHPILNVNAITNEYVDAISQLPIRNVLNPRWKENPELIKKLMLQLTQFDTLRGQDWRQVFPEVAGFYSRYL